MNDIATNLIVRLNLHECYRFYRSNFEYSRNETSKADPPADQTKSNTIKVYDSNNASTARASEKLPVSSAELNKARSRSASGSVGNRILSAFRSNTHSKGEKVIQIKSVSVTSSSPATYPARVHQTDTGGKTSIANIFPSIGSTGSYSTAQEGLTSEHGHGSDIDKTTEPGNKLSDSGIGQSPLKQAGNNENDKPADPEEVLKRTKEPTQPVNAVKLIAGEPPTTSSKALDRLIGIPNETPAKAVSTLTGMFV